MTYVVVTPNASQSPGNFPSQANENFGRLKTIINADHVFNDSTAVDDGAHRQMTMVNRSDPVGPPATGTNGIMYSRVGGTATLPAFWDGSTARDIAQCFSGTTNISNATVPVVYTTIFPDPGYEYSGTLTIQGNNEPTVARTRVVSRTSYGNAVTGSGGLATQFSGNNLQVAGAGGGATQVKWALSISRVS